MDPNFAAIVEAINTAAQPKWAVYLLLASSVVLAATAVIALLIAVRHWLASEDQTDVARAAANQARLSTILQISSQWDSDGNRKSREEFLKFKQEVDDSVRNHGGLEHLTDEQKRSTLELEYTTRLGNMRDSDLDKYLLIMEMLGFFEDLAFFIQYRYIDEHQILDLYGPALRTAHTVLGPHIAKRIQDGEVEDKYFEHFRGLRKKVFP